MYPSIGWMKVVWAKRSQRSESRTNRGQSSAARARSRSAWRSGSAAPIPISAARAPEQKGVPEETVLTGDEQLGRMLAEDRGDPLEGHD